MRPCSRCPIADTNILCWVTNTRFVFARFFFLLIITGYLRQTTFIEERSWPGPAVLEMQDWGPSSGPGLLAGSTEHHTARDREPNLSLGSNPTDSTQRQWCNLITCHRLCHSQLCTSEMPLTQDLGDEIAIWVGERATSHSNRSKILMFCSSFTWKTFNGRS